MWTNILYILGAYISKSKWFYNAKPSAFYFYVKTKIWLHFQICISVPLMKGQLRSLSIFERVILNTKWKDCKSHKNLCTKSFTYTKKVYVYEIAAVNLLKIYLLENAKKTCKLNNRDLNCDWISAMYSHKLKKCTSKYWCNTNIIQWFRKTIRSQKWLQTRFQTPCRKHKQKG